MLVALDLQHSGRPDKLNDRGAVFKDFEEVQLTRRIMNAADVSLRRLGHTVIPLSDGYYVERQQRARDYGARIYVGLHVATGGCDFGRVFYDYRRSRIHGLYLAQLIADHMERHFAYDQVVSPACPYYPEETSAYRVWEYLEGLEEGGPIGLVFEPGFMDGPRWHSKDFIERVEEAGMALASGLHAWALYMGEPANTAILSTAR